MTEAEFREFIREHTLRHERASRSTEAWLRIADERTKEMIRRGDVMIAELERQREEFRKELRAQRKEFRAESKAQRAALFAILDRLNGDDPPPAPA